MRAAAPLFTTRRVRVADGITIHAVVGGAGPPVLLLHGWPQTHAMRQAVAPVLARTRTVVCADLRGCGDSSKLRGAGDHAHYSKRVMAETMAQAVGLDGMFGRLARSTGSVGSGLFHPSAWAEYRRCSTPAMVHASCEDYRASAGIDLQHDQTDMDAGRKLAMPVLAIWSTRGVVARLFDPLAEWQAAANRVTGLGLEAGHTVPEESAGPTDEAIANFTT
jgi:haloacetate dehalogenase